jgi:hypothetical protein
MPTIRSCTELALASLYALLLAMFCPVMIGTAAHIVFTPGSVVCTLVTLVCFTWGSRNFCLWWARFHVMTHGIVHHTRFVAGN